MKDRYLGLLLFAPLALAGNEFGSLLRYPDLGAAVLFPPYAALTAALVVNPRRDWVWYIVIGSAAHFVTHWPQWSFSWVMFADVANIARALAAAILLRSLLGDSLRLDGISRLLLFGIAAVLVAPAVGATIGAASVVAHGASDTYWRPWIGWFVSNALTGLAMLPACIAAFEWVANGRRLGRQYVPALEVIALLFTLAVTCAVAFWGDASRQLLALPLYAPLLVLIWAALRFGASGASVALTVVACAAIWSVDRGAGPSIARSPEDNVFALQIFVLFTSASVLCLATIATARRNAVQLYLTLLASLQDHVAILDTNGVVIEVNDSWRQFADSAEAASFHRVRVGNSYVSAHRAAAERGVVPAAEVLAGVTAVLGRQRRRFQLEYEYRPNGRLESFITTVDALERLDGGAVVTRTNVTARRQAQLDLEEQRRELSHLARVSVLGQLSGAFAHELNQPLAAILTNAEAARRLIRRQPIDLEELAAILHDIAADDQRAAAVIQRLRALLRRGDRRLQSIDPRELIEEVLQLAHTELLTRRIDIVTQIQPNLPRFPGDKVQLQQVFLNLILNACEAMSAATFPDRRVILTADADGNGDVHIAIRDFGTGIPAHLLGRLFEPFVTTKPDGLGLGLSISRTIVAAHGGRLWAENKTDGGAHVHCVFPLLKSSPGIPRATAHSLVTVQER